MTLIHLINSPKNDWIQIERVLDDSCCWLTGSQNILFSRQITVQSDAIQIVEITNQRTKLEWSFKSRKCKKLLFSWIRQLIFTSAIKTCLNARILPQSFDVIWERRLEGHDHLVIFLFDCVCFFLSSENLFDKSLTMWIETPIAKK